MVGGLLLIGLAVYFWIRRRRQMRMEPDPLPPPAQWAATSPAMTSIHPSALHSPPQSPPLPQSPLPFSPFGEQHTAASGHQRLMSGSSTGYTHSAPTSPPGSPPPPPQSRFNPPMFSSRASTPSGANPFETPALGAGYNDPFNNAIHSQNVSSSSGNPFGGDETGPTPVFHDRSPTMTPSPIYASRANTPMAFAGPRTSFSGGPGFSPADS